jgi:predicted secreted protein
VNLGFAVVPFLTPIFLFARSSGEEIFDFIFVSVNEALTCPIYKPKIARPNNIENMPNIFPAKETGEISPYPTVLIVTILHQNASNTP